MKRILVEPGRIDDGITIKENHFPGI